MKQNFATPFPAKRYSRVSRTVLVTVFLLFSFNTSAAVRISTVSTDDGLQANATVCVNMDSRGFIWIGSWGGLDRLDGFEIKNFNTLDSGESLGSLLVLDIKEDKDNCLWLRTPLGLDKLDLKADSYSQYGYGKGFNMTGELDCYDISDEGTVFYINPEGTLSFYDKENDCFQAAQSSGNTIRGIKSLSCQEKDLLYILTEDGILKTLSYETRSGELSFKTPVEVGLGTKYTGMIASGDYLLLRSEEIFSLFDKKNGITSECPYGDSFKEEIGGFCHHGDDFYIVTGGLVYSIDFQKKEIRQEDMFSDKIVRSIFFDKNDQIWACTANEGAAYLHEGNVFGHTHTQIKGKAFPTTSIVADRFGNIYSGCNSITERGLFLNGEVCSFPKGKQPSSNGISMILPAMREDDFFIVTNYGVDVISVNEKGVKDLQNIFLSDAMILNATFDKNRKCIYVSCFGYDFFVIDISLEDGTYKTVRKKSIPFIGSQYVMEIILIDDGGNLLISTMDDGVFIYDPSNARTAPAIITHDGKNCNYMYFRNLDCKGNLWAYTDKGLSIMHRVPSGFSIDRIIDTDEMVQNIQEGADGLSYMATKSNMLAYNPADGEITAYNDELTNFKDIFTSASCLCGRNGHIYMGTNKGYVEISPEDLVTVKYDPDIVITKVSFGPDEKKSLHYPEDGFILKNSERSIEINYSGIGFSGNSNISFEYSLDNGKWISNGGSRKVVFSNLRPGRHVLRLISTDSCGSICANEISLAFRIRYPLYLQWWAFLTYMILLSAGFFFWRMQSEARKRIQEEKRLRIQKEQEISTKLDFFANIAHDFNSPLTVITNCGDNLTESHGLNDEDKKNISLICRNADKLSKMILDLTEFRKADNGGFQPEYSRFNLAKTLRIAAESCLAPSKEKKLKSDISIDKESYFVSDRAALEKIMTVLLSNAYGYAPEKGTVHLSSVMQSEGVEIKIRISGTGTNCDNIEHLFDKYSAFECVGKEEGSGIPKQGSLGLALAKKLVETLGGKLTVSGQNDDYMEFCLFIPEASAPEEKKPTQDLLWQSFGDTPKILIVDDDRDILETLSTCLSNRFEISTALNGKEALEMLEVYHPDIIITDINMPQLNGIELISHVRKDAFMANIPIIAMSVDSDTESQIRGIQTGASVFLPKPFNLKQLNAIIDRFLENNAAAKEFYSSSAQSIEFIHGKKISAENKKFIAQIIRITENNLTSEDFNISMLAEALSVSEPTFYRRVKNSVGMTPVELIRFIRLNYAANLLKNTSLTVLEIMDRSGFKSRTYFYRIFTEQFKLTPKEYRNQS